MVYEFAKLSGDYNPLHMDENYSKSTKFNKRVCHGLLLTSFFSQLVGMHLPGKNALYLSQTVKFMSPCFIDEEICIEGEIIDKSPSTKIITIKTIITNSSVNCISPSMIDTPLIEKLPQKFKEIHSSQTPLGRLGEPQDVSSMALFLCSSYSDYISGENFLITGAGTMH